MESRNKYIPLIFIIPALIRSITHPPQLTLGSIGLFVVILLLFGLFVYLEKSMEKRIRRFDRIKDHRFLYILSFSLLCGLPLSLVLTWSWESQIKLLYAILFIVLPTVVIFGWAGLMDWKECQKKYLELKYSQHTNNAA
jgi:hypothetical protein